MKIHTRQDWKNSDANNFDDYCLPYSQIDDTIYYYFMDILPPLYCSSGFMVSEPYSTCDKYNTFTYACFVQLNGKYYYLGNISPKAVDDEIVKLKSMLESEA